MKTTTENHGLIVAVYIQARRELSESKILLRKSSEHRSPLSDRCCSTATQPYPTSTFQTDRGFFRYDVTPTVRCTTRDFGDDLLIAPRFVTRQQLHILLKTSLLC